MFSSDSSASASGAPRSCWVLTRDERFLERAADGLSPSSVSVRALHPDELRPDLLGAGDALLLDWREVSSREKALGALCSGLGLTEPAGVAIVTDGLEPLATAPLLGFQPPGADWHCVAAELARFAALRARLLGPQPTATAAPVDRPATRSRAIEEALGRAIEDGELELYYQPRQRARTGLITGAEALLRWNSATLGQVSPADFIPVAEDVGLITPMGEWVMRTLCAQVAHWERAGVPLRFSFNVSAAQLAFGQLYDTLLSALSESGVSPHNIEIEVTESVAIDRVERTAWTLDRLRRAGVQVALDDFGTGYSTLRALLDLPLDTLKLDRSILAGLGTNPDAASVAGAMIRMAHELDLSVVAEGVESAAQLEILRDLDCDEVQGFYYAPPLPRDAFERRVAKQSRRWERFASSVPSRSVRPGVGS